MTSWIKSLATCLVSRHNLKLDKKSSCSQDLHANLAQRIQEITIWSSPCRRYVQKKNAISDAHQSHFWKSYPGMVCDQTPQKLKALTEMPPPKTRKELQAFLGIISYSSMFSPCTVDVCESLRQLTSSKTEWIWNAPYQTLFNNRRCVHEILWWNPVAVPGDRCIWNQTGSFPTTNQIWYKLPKRQRTRQQHTQTHSICKEEPVKCKKKI